MPPPWDPLPRELLVQSTCTCLVPKPRPTAQSRRPRKKTTGWPLVPADACTAHTWDSGQLTRQQVSQAQKCPCHDTSESQEVQDCFSLANSGNRETTANALAQGETENTVQKAYKAAGRTATLSQTQEPPGPRCSSWGGRPGSRTRRVPWHAAALPSPGGWSGSREGGWCGGEQRRGGAGRGGRAGVPLGRPAIRAHAFWLPSIWAASPCDPATPTGPQTPCGRRNAVILT